MQETEQEITTDLFDYMKWRGDLTLEQDPFNKIDAMILSRLSYVPFELAMEQRSEKLVSIKSIAKTLLAAPDLEERVLDKREVELLKAIKKTKRFAELEACEFVNLYDEVSESQFSSIAIKIGRGVWVLVYRGTDDTLIGWKEDWNMAYTFPIAGQEHAREYVETFAEKHRGKLILCGHSKGGNIAVYAAAFCKRSVQDRIEAVYNYDGPGFMPQVLENPGYERVCNRVHTFIPQDSFFGVMMGRLETPKVVHSTANLLYQHSVYTWSVLGTEYAYEADTTEGSKNANEAVCTFVYRMNKEQREAFGEVLFDLLGETEAKTIGELTGNKGENSKKIITKIRNMDEESKKIISEAWDSFVKIAWAEVTPVKRLRGGKKNKV